MNEVRQQLRAANQMHGLWQASDTVVVAVSTGVDSMVLLDVLRHLPKSERPTLVVAHVNHQLRAQSDVEEASLRAQLASTDVPLVVTSWPKEDHPQMGVEAAARAFRYDFFERVMRKYGATVLMTAHQQDEQAETIMMRVIEGRSFTEPLGIAWQRPFGPGRLVRPLLGISKAAIRAYADDHQVMSFEDETNMSLTVLRNRTRHQVLPQLRAENPRFDDDLVANAADLAEMMAVMGKQAHEVVRHANGSLQALMSDALPISLLLKTAFSECAPEVSVSASVWRRLAVNLPTMRPQATIDLGRGWQLQRHYDQIMFVKRESGPQKIRAQTLPDQQTMVPLNKWQSVTEVGAIGAWSAEQTVTMWPAFRSVHVRVSPTDWPLIIRPARGDDRLALANGGHQSVRRIMINQKVATAERSQQLLVTTVTGTPLWLVGRKVAATAMSGQVIELCLKPTQGVEYG
ncbi:tRNA lysidine(34) synthetase TilS [Furfurilactobacillus sp. WILCCON 0119]